MKCGIPQGLILGPLLFLIYVNDLNLAPDVLNPIMFAGDTNLFYSRKDNKTLFHTVNTKLVKVNHWLKTNKLSSNVKKSNYTHFYKPSTKRVNL